jgi:hypothetical protein
MRRYEWLVDAFASLLVLMILFYTSEFLVCAYDLLSLLEATLVKRQTFGCTGTYSF